MEGHPRTIFPNRTCSFLQEDFFMYSLNNHSKNWPYPLQPGHHVCQWIKFILAILVGGQPRTIRAKLFQNQPNQNVDLSNLGTGSPKDHLIVPHY